jgi:hypothetical protein
MRKQRAAFCAREWLRAFGQFLREEIDRRCKRGEYDAPTEPPITEVAPSDWRPPKDTQC